MSETSVQHLMSMGYSEGQAKRALKVTGNDIEQAVGYLLLGSTTQANFPHASPERTRQQVDVSSGRLPDFPIMEGESGGPSATTSIKSGPFSVVDEKLDELIEMGYSRHSASNALAIANGDVSKAVSFLLMGESRTGFMLDLQSSFQFEDDAAMAIALQEGELENAEQEAVDASVAAAVAARVSVPRAPDSGMYHPTSMRANKDVPKMVVSQSFLDSPGAATFCACMAASKFLGGGVVTAEFLNEILASGTELYRKKSKDKSIKDVLKKYGNSPLRIEMVEATTEDEKEPKEGIWMAHDLHHDDGIRKKLSMCRNQQPAGWQVLLLEIPPSVEALCIALPPKGTKNKFWYLDFRPRPCFRAVGAYARVHSSLLQLEESLEAIFKSVCKKTTEIEQNAYEYFHLYRIQRVARR